MADQTVNAQINLEASADDRKGKYANFFTISNGDRIAILDCFLIDIAAESEEGQLRSGILTSRVLMDVAGVVQLRDMLNDHIEKNGWVPTNG